MSPSPLPPPLPNASPSGGPRRNAFQRNLKWALPLSAVLLLGGVGFFIWVGLHQVTSRLESSVPYKLAVERASQDMQVREALGQQMQAEALPMGNVGEFAGTGVATLVIRIKGPQGKGILVGEATRTQAEWRFDKLTAKLPGSHDEVDLRTSEEKACALMGHCP